MTSSQPLRHPAGTPVGGRFAPGGAQPPGDDVALVDDLDEDGDGEPDNLLFIFEDEGGRELEVDYRGDGQFAVYHDSELLAEFTSLADPDDHLSAEEAVLRELGS